MSDEEMALRIYNAGLRSCGMKKCEELDELKPRQLAELVEARQLLLGVEERKLRRVQKKLRE